MSRMPLFSEQQVVSSVRIEPALVLLSLALGSWAFYKLFLRNVSPERHRIFTTHFGNLRDHIGVALFLFGLYELLDWLGGGVYWASKLQMYTGVMAIIWASIVFVKILRIIAFEYLFMTSMRAGVPLLLVNIFTLIASLVLSAWVLTSIFEVRLAPLVATSALLSVVLGLALQDTLGNLFAAVALQFDKPFDLGDWIEVRNGSDRVAGQVQEVTWRATLLLAVTDELISLPNRYMSQSQISNFGAHQRSFVRSHVFRFPHDAPVAQAKEVLVETARAVVGIAVEPSPVAIITDTSESWVAIKIVYSVSNYGAQFGIADRFYTAALANLQAAGIKLATARLAVEKAS